MYRKISKDFDLPNYYYCCCCIITTFWSHENYIINSIFFFSLSFKNHSCVFVLKANTHTLLPLTNIKYSFLCLFFSISIFPDAKFDFFFFVVCDNVWYLWIIFILRLLERFFSHFFISTSRVKFHNSNKQFTYLMVRCFDGTSKKLFEILFLILFLIRPLIVWITISSYLLFYCMNIMWFHQYLALGMSLCIHSKE